MFIIIMWPAFFARVRPVTKNAKPTCMNNTRKPVISVQVKLIETPRWAVSRRQCVDAVLRHRDVGRDLRIVAQSC